MALSRVKRWNRNEILLSTDLNAEFDNLVNNAQSLVFPLTQDLDVGGYLMNDTGFTAPIQLHENLQSLDGKYANDIGAAIAGIGLSAVTLMIAAPTTVSGTYTVPSNIHLWFVGQGSLSINGGSTLTITNPSQITATSSQTLFGGAGTVLFTQSGVVTPCWWGFLPSATDAVNLSAYNACTASLPSAGGVVVLPPGIYQTSGTLTHGNKPISVVGAHQDLSIIESTSTTSSDHGLIFSNSFHLKNLTIKTATSLASNLSMRAVSLFAPSTTNRHAVLEHVKVRGFNTGVYIDGGASRNIDRVLLRDIDIQTSGPASDYAGSCLYIVRCTQVECYGAVLDQNSTGNHAILLEGNTNLTVVSTKVRNATRTGAFSVYAVGVDGTSSAVYKSWTFQGLDVESCYNGVLIRTYDTESLHCASLRDSSFKNITGEAGIPGAITVTTSDTSRIRNVAIDKSHMENLGYRGLHVSMASGAFVDQISWTNSTAYNWSTASSGTYSLFGQDSSGTNYHSHLENLTVDGNSNGRCILNTNSLATSCKRATYKNLIERNTTTPGFPITTSGQSGAGQDLNFAFGYTLYLNNASSCTYTTASNAVPGERYCVIGANANSVITDNATFNLTGGNWTSASRASLLLECLDSTPTFIEVIRGTT